MLTKEISQPTVTSCVRPQARKMAEGDVVDGGLVSKSADAADVSVVGASKSAEHVTIISLGVK